MKKRVLQLIGSFHQGGSERQAVALSRLLQIDGTFDVFAATLNNEGVLAAEMAEAGFADIPEYRLNSFYDLNFFRQVRRCSADLRNNKIDIVHTHDFYSNIFGMAAASLARVPVRIASKRETGMRTSAQDVVEGLAFGRAHAVVSNSAAAKQMLAARGFSNVRVIYNGADLTKFEKTIAAADARRQFGLPTSPRLVTVVANLRHDVKNIPMLLRAAQNVSSADIDVHFAIAGEGELQAGLKAMAAELGIDQKSTFLGRCDDISSLLAASDICVLTSDSEGLSNSLIEYMAAGKPVVATNVGGAAEVIVEDETGYLVPAGDDVMLAARILKLLAEPDLVRRMGAAGRLRAGELFSNEALLANTLGLYNSLLDR